MRGLGRMLIAITTLSAALACEGCAQLVTQADLAAASGPAAAISEGMNLAVPSPLGSPIGESQALAASDFAGPVQKHFGSTTIISSPVNLIGEPLDQESITASFAAIETDLFESSLWDVSQALTLIAADKRKSALLEPQDDTRNIAAEVSFAVPGERTGLAFDVGLAPRIAYNRDGDYSSHKYGGEVRIGQNFDKRGTNYEPAGSWYVFAGADGEAVVWDASDSRASLDSLALTDQVTVGDMQAGISLQRGGGQLSLSYIRREVRYYDRNGGARENEDFAGVSFTLRR